MAKLHALIAASRGFVLVNFHNSDQSGIPKKFLVGQKRTWVQKLSPGLMLLMFMVTQFFHFCFAASPLLPSNASVTRKCCSSQFYVQRNPRHTFPEQH